MIKIFTSNYFIFEYVQRDMDSHFARIREASDKGLYTLLANPSIDSLAETFPRYVYKNSPGNNYGMNILNVIEDLSAVVLNVHTKMDEISKKITLLENRLHATEDNLRSLRESLCES